MKRILISLIIFFASITLLGCDQTNSTTSKSPVTTNSPVDDITDETKEHNLYVDNFENFFTVNTKISNDTINPVLTISLENKNQVIIDNIFLEVMVYFTYYKEYVQEIRYETFTFTNEDINKDVSRVIDLLEDIESPKVFYIEPISANGKVSTLKSMVIHEKEYIVPTFEPQPYTLNIDNDNLDLYYELVEKFSDLNNIDQSKLKYNLDTYTSLETEFGFENEADHQEIKIDYTDFYVEHVTNDDKYIILYESDRYFRYPILKENYHDNQVRVNPEVIDLDIGALEDGYLPAISNELLYITHPSQVEITFTNDIYKVVGYAKHILPEADFSLIKESYTSIGIDENTIENLIVEQLYDLSLKGYTVETKMIVPIYIGDMKTLEVITSESMYYDTFSKVDIHNNSEFIILPPDHMNEVKELSDISQMVYSSYNPFPQHYYYVYLESGQYEIIDPDSELGFDLYSEHGDLIDSKRLSKISYSDDFIFVEEDGYYYLEVSGKTTGAIDGYGFSLKHLDYQTIYSDSNQEELLEGYTTINIEGESDYVGYNFIIEEPTLFKISISNPDQVLSFLFKHPRISSYSQYYLDDIWWTYIEMAPGTHEIIFMSHIMGEKEILVERVDTSNHKNDSFDSMAQMPTEFLSEPVYVSEILGKAYYKLEVQEELFISFRFNRIKYLSLPAINILDENFNPIVDYSFYTEDRGLKLEPGKYIFEIESNMHAGSDIHCVVEDYGDKHYEIDLEVAEVMDPFDDDFPTISSRHFDDHVSNYFWFTLEQEEIVYIRGGHTEIYNDNDDQISFLASSESFYGDYFKLSAGRYYIKTYNLDYSTTISYTIQLAIISDLVNDDNYHGISLNEIEVSPNFNIYKKDNQFDQEWLKIYIDEARTYLVYTNTAFIILDNEGAPLGYLNNYEDIYLDVGTYYIQLETYGFDNDEWQFYIK